MTEEELDRLQALADAATPGEWQASTVIAGMITHDQHGWIAHCPRGSCKETEQMARQDAAFIAAARAALPRLIAEVRRLRQEYLNMKHNWERNDAELSNLEEAYETAQAELDEALQENASLRQQIEGLEKCP
jgi:predicted RNase H-like nuclease (RuvC/YqgF family)